MGGVYEVMARCHDEASPGEPHRSRAEAEGYLRHPPGAEARDYWIDEANGHCVGFAQLGVLEGSQAGYVAILVHPDARRRGSGTALLAAVREQAQARGAAKLFGDHATEAGARFAADAGASELQRVVRSLLRLPLTATSEAVPGYRLQSWAGPAPDTLLDSYAAARNAINDAPGFDEDPAVWTPAFVRDLETVVARRDREMRITVALDERGEVAAFTELRVTRTPGATASTEDTAVMPEHRRRGLARWVKVESLLRLQQDRPDVRLATTSNAEENRAMLELNRALGFVPVAVRTTSLLQV